MLGPRLEQLRGAKLAAERDLSAAAPGTHLDADTLRTIIEDRGPIVDVLAEADPADKANLYNELELELTFYA